MDVEIREETTAALAGYAAVPSVSEVRERLTVLAPEGGLGGLHLVVEPVSPPWVKDYDAAPGKGPLAWAEAFDVTRWGLLSAWVGGERAGGAVVVRDGAGVAVLAGRADLAVLWDLRVAPGLRRRGVGAALFRAAEAWAAARGAAWLEVETQNVNVPACRFYVRQGCVLGAVHRFAYPGLPEEVRLLWYKRIGPSGDA